MEQEKSDSDSYNLHTNNEPYTNGVHAILEDVSMYSTMPLEELRPLLKELAFNHLRDAQGHTRFAGRSALRRLQTLAEQTLLASPSRRYLSVDRTIRIVRDRFGQTFLGRDFPDFSEDELKRLFEGWVEEAASDCVRRIHLIPCDLALEGVDQISVGPVTLRAGKAFWSDFETELEVYKQEIDSDGRQIGDMTTAAARDYFGTFRDIAEVVVPGCDEPTSQDTARSALQAVLDFLHLAAGAGYTARMRGPGPAVGSDRRATVVRVDGRLRITSSFQMAGAHIGNEGWRQMTGSDGERWLAPLAGSLWTLVNRQELPLFADRFIDACGWYGDAAREPSPAAAAVKFVTAMERLLWTGETGSGITKRVSERLAALCFSVHTWNFAQVEAAVRDAYDLRSALLHGRISKSDPDVGRRLQLCERYARELLLSWWDRFGGMFSTEISVAQLRDHLEKFTRQARQAVRERDANIGPVPR